MNFRVLTSNPAHTLTSIKDLWPYAILGLGGVLTVAWVVFLTWIPVRLIASFISLVIGQMTI